jgi:hypothetical protein
VRLIGTVIQLQIQVSSLKVGQPPRQRYDPTPLRSVRRLTLSEGGVSAEVEGDGLITDIHHRDHPHSKNRNGTNGVSLCFTSHYAAMREAFGAWLTDGVAGENLLIETEFRLGKDDLGTELVLKQRDDNLARLDSVAVATPCVEFARFALQFPLDARPDPTVAAALRFLNDGMRGYYASYNSPEITISVGDELFVEDAHASGR